MLRRRQEEENAAIGGRKHDVTKSIKLGIVALTTRKVDQGRQDIEKDVKYECYVFNRIKKTGEDQEIFKRTI